LFIDSFDNKKTSNSIFPTNLTRVLDGVRLVLEVMMLLYKETPTIELKREFIPDIKKEAVAFANTEGGTIYVGIDDNGEIVGVKDSEKVLLQIMNMLRDSIKPDISMFTSCKVENVENKEVIAISIQRGTNIPYYITEKGLKPSGVYVRQGTASAPASENAIRQMIKETDGDKFEEIRSFNQELTFETVSSEFKKRGLELGEAQMKTLGLISIDNMFTNLGLLLSEQCIHTVKVAVFSGTSKSEFKDRREFGGSLLKQITAIYEFIDLLNKTKAEFEGLERIDHRDYPEEALREALLNSIVHRDYSYSGSTLINIYDDRIEFVSIGGLVKGISLNDITLGISQTRNEKLASVFYRLKLIEAYGTGIIKIMDSYASSRQKPVLKASDNAFSITLPNLNFKTKIELTFGNNHELRILEYLKINNSINRKEAEELLNVGQTMAGRVLKEMVNKGLLNAEGKAANTKYLLI
jgi:ATP-dependent DNA helicase RecG